MALRAALWSQLGHTEVTLTKVTEESGCGELMNRSEGHALSEFRADADLKMSTNEVPSSRERSLVYIEWTSDN